MSKIKNSALDQYGAEPFEQQQFGTAGGEAVKAVVRTHTEHFEYGKSSACLLRRAPYFQPSVVAGLASAPSAAARLSAFRGTAAVSKGVGAGAIECRTPYGASDERVQHADDQHRNDEEDDAGRLEEVLEVRHVSPNSAHRRVGDRASVGVILVYDAELDPDRY